MVPPPGQTLDEVPFSPPVRVHTPPTLTPPPTHPYTRLLSEPQLYLPCLLPALSQPTAPSVLLPRHLLSPVSLSSSFLVLEPPGAGRHPHNFQGFPNLVLSGPGDGGEAEAYGLDDDGIFSGTGNLECA